MLTLIGYNHFMINWINVKQKMITSLLVWDQFYEPYQTIIFRQKYQTHESLIYYVKLDSVIFASPITLFNFRTETEEERHFFIAKKALEIIENALNQIQSDETGGNPQPNLPLDALLKEAFLSPLALELMREKAPDYGYYSISPNFKKLQKMLEAKPYHILEFIDSLKFIR